MVRSRRSGRRGVNSRIGMRVDWVRGKRLFFRSRRKSLRGEKVGRRLSPNRRKS